MQAKSRRRFSRWSVRCYRADTGALLWAEHDIPNMLHNEGEEWMLDVLFTQLQSVPAAYYIGLDNRAALAEADTLATVAAGGEPVGNGYARKAVNSDDTDWTLSQVGGDWRATSKQVQFVAAGAVMGPVSKLFLTNVASGSAGVLIASVALSQSRTLADGDAIDVSCYVSPTEP